MREIVVVDESIKKSKKNARQVLDKYLFRIGANSWRGKASNQCIENISKELRKTTSRGTSVTCHDFTKSRSGDVLFHIGNTKHLKNGRYAINTSRVTEERMPAEFDAMPIIKIAARFHDLGKMFNGFQNKIMASLDGKTKSPDPFRHEFISALVFDSLINGHTSSNEAVIERLSGATVDDINAAISTTTKRMTDLYAECTKNQPDQVLAGFGFTDNEISHAIGMLILTHHSLAHSYKGKVSCHGYVRVKGLELPVGHDLFHVSGDAVPFFAEKGWIETFQKDAAAIDTAFTFNGCTDMFLRTCLILADHQGSSEAEAYQKTDDAAKHFAKTTSVDGKRVLSDELKTHTKKVLNNSRRAFDALVTCRNDFPAVEADNIPYDIMNPTKTGNFGWQGKTCEAVQDTVMPDSGFFACIMAGTGTGKTRIAPSIFAAITRKTGTPIRYTLCQPLRVLATQTANEYCNDLRFSPNDVAARVSNDPIRFTDEETGSNDDDDDSVNIDAADFEIEFPTPADDSDQWAASLSYDVTKKSPAFISTVLGGSYKNTVMRDMADVPILCCTIDYVIGIASALRSKHIPGAVRVITSDIVIDEIDALSAEDLEVVRRFAYHVGCAGRKMVVMSATVLKDIAVPLYEAYRAGYECYATSFKKPNQVSFLTASNQDNSIFTDGTFESCYVRTCVTILNDTENDAKRIGEVIDLYTNHPDALPEVASKRIDVMHKRHATDFDGTSVSVGFIRLTRIAHTVDLAQMLPLETSSIPDTERFFVCLHSQFPKHIRQYEEVMLKKYLTRKNDDGMKAMLRSIDSNAKNIQIIVVCSPVIETGNDIDFDYAILDLSSTRSLIQSAGRVNRHRNRDVTQPNVAVISKPLVTLTNKDHSFSSPGVETKPAKVTFVDPVRINSKKYHVTELLDLDTPDHFSITSKMILKNETNPLMEAETEYVKRFICDPEAPRFPRYTRNIVTRRTWRRSDRVNREVYVGHDGSFMMKTEGKTVKSDIVLRNVDTNVTITNPLFKTFPDRETNISLSLRSDVNVATLEFFYSDHLGFFV